MTIKKLANLKFKGENGYYICKGFGLYEEGKGFVTFEETTLYNPTKKALQCILDAGGLTGEVKFVQPMN